MKILNVTEPKQFEMLYEALLGKREGYSIKQARVIGKVFDKMEAVGKVKETISPGVDLYTCDPPVTFELEDEEFQQAKQIFDSMTWMGVSARKAVAIADWLDEAEKNAKSPTKLQAI